MREDSFSIIIACRHRADLLHETLEAVADLDYAGENEIIVLDDQSQGGREETASAAAYRGLHVRYFRLPGISTPAAWNLAVREASRNYLAFLDDDCMPPAGWLSAFKSCFAEWTAGVIGGPDRVPPKASAFEKSLEYVLNSFVGTMGVRTGKSLVSSYYPRTWNMAARKESVRFAGGFNEDAPDAPEISMIARLEKIGYKARFEPKAWVWHHRRTNLFKFILRDLRLGAVRGRGMSPPGLSRVYVAVLLLLAIFAGVAIRSGIEFTGQMLIWPAGVYAAVLVVAGLHAGVLARSPIAAVSVPFMLGLHHAAHFAGFVSGQLTRRSHQK